MGTRFIQDERGASALEFALIAAPLFALIFGVMQVGYIYLANFSLDGAVSSGARMIRTGQVQTQGLNAAKFKDKVCEGFVGPLVCGNLTMDVRSYDSFGAAASGLTPGIGSDGKANTNTAFDPGGAEDVVVVRAFYQLPLASIFPSSWGLDSMANLANGDRLLISTAAFRNEPYM